MGRLLYRTVDTIVVVLCLPFYAVIFPLMRLHDWAVPRFRRVRLGMEVIHWTARDQREDVLVVDTSPLPAGRVGVRRRNWSPMGRYGSPPPPYGKAIEFWPVADFWLGRRP